MLMSPEGAHREIGRYKPGETAWVAPTMVIAQRLLLLRLAAHRLSCPNKTLGASKGPRTPGGRQKCAEVKTVHGRESRAIRAIRDEKLRERRDLERFMKTQGMIK